MKKLHIGLILLLAGLFIMYASYKSRHESIPDVVTYGLGIVSCLVITILLYSLLQYFKKK